MHRQVVYMQWAVPSFEDIEAAFRAGTGVRFRIISMNSSMEAEAEHAVRSMLELAGRPDLSTLAYSVLKELVLNGIKANFKRIWCEERGIPVSNLSQDDTESFKRTLNEKTVDYYAHKSRQSNLTVTADLLIRDEELRISVRNNACLTGEEQRRIEEKIREASKFESLAEYYMAMADSAEGEGMGLAMVLILLRSSGYDATCLHISTDQIQETTAQVVLNLAVAG